MNEEMNKLFDILKNIAKAVFVAPFALSFTAVGIWYLFDKLPVIYALLAEKVYAFTYIFEELFFSLFMLSVAALMWRILFSKKLANIPVSRLILITVVMLIGAANFGVMDDRLVSDFKYYAYPSYILDWPAQSITQTMECDYTQDKIYLSGYFNFVDNGFRTGENCVELAYNEKLTDSYRVEIRYKGLEAKMNVYHMDYRMEDDGLYMDDIFIWPTDYDYELSPEDVVYMYRHGHDLRYADPLVIEKIIIRTAYPEKFDLSEINS